MSSTYGLAAGWGVVLMPLVVAGLSVLVLVLAERLLRQWLRNTTLRSQEIEERTWLSTQRDGTEGGNR